MTLLINAASIKIAELNSVTGHLTPSGTPRVVLLRFGLKAINLLLTYRTVENGYAPPPPPPPPKKKKLCYCCIFIYKGLVVGLKLYVVVRKERFKEAGKSI